MSHPIHAALAAAVIALAAPVPAQVLRDPTLPPNAAAMQIGETIPVGPVLQSVLIAKDRRYAVIDGRQISLGEKFGDARLVRITESEVTLEGSEGRKTLKLFPGVQKTLARRTDPSPKTRFEAVQK